MVSLNEMLYLQRRNDVFIWKSTQTLVVQLLSEEDLDFTLLYRAVYSCPVLEIYIVDNDNPSEEKMI
jgi:hypothetical protein